MTSHESDIQPVFKTCHGEPGGLRIATLSDARGATMSVSFAKSYLGPEDGEILGFESFEKAVDAARLDLADVVLVPGAYPHIADLYADAEIELWDQFVELLPPVLWSASPTPEVLGKKLFRHPALNADAKRLAAVVGGRFEVIDAMSNPDACEQVIKDASSTALAPEPIAEQFGLRPIREVRRATRMSVVLFALRD